MQESTLSIVMPNYNHARFLPQSIGALLAQNRRPDELIIIDDGSTDDSISVIERLIAGATGARLVRNERNLGVVATMNRGAALVGGDFVYFAAADDMVLPGFFRRSLDLLERFPQAALCSALAMRADPADRLYKTMPTPIPCAEPCFLSPDRVRRLLLREDNWMIGSTVVYRRRPLLATGDFRSELEAYCDAFAAQVLALRHGACFLPEPLAAWHQMEGGYAWQLAVDAKRADRIAEAAVRLMREVYADLFPPGHAGRWRRRWEFGNRRFAQRVAQRSAFTANASWPYRTRLRLADAGKTAFWFFRLRPFDLIPTVRRRLRHAILARYKRPPSLVSAPRMVP